MKSTAVGPADALIFKGHVRLIHSKVTGYDLASKLSDITRFSGITIGRHPSFRSSPPMCCIAPRAAGWIML